MPGGDAGLGLQFHDARDAFSGLRAAWQARADAMGAYGPFLGPDWCELWWEHFGAPGGAELCVATLGDDAAILPLYRAAGLVSFLGGQDVTDYVGVVGPPELHALAGEALIEHLAGDPDWAELRAVAVPAESGFTVAAGLAAIRHEFDVAFRNVESAMLELPRTFDAYLEHVGKKERHEIRRKERRLAREVGPLELEADGPLPDAMERFAAMHRRAAGEKGSFMTGEMEAFFLAVAGRFRELGTLRLDTLFAAGAPVASTLGFADPNGYYLYNSAFDPEYRAFSPGNVLLAMLVQREVEAGRPIFDFMRGDERYKFRLGATSRPLRRLEVRRG